MKRFCSHWSYLIRNHLSFMFLYFVLKYLPLLKHKIIAYKSASSTAPCPTTALTSSKCNNSVKNKMCSTHYLMLLYIFARLHKIPETIFKLQKGHMTWITIKKTCLYNFNPLKPHFYIVKLGFTGVYIIFLISA